LIHDYETNTKPKAQQGTHQKDLDWSTAHDLLISIYWNDFTSVGPPGSIKKRRQCGKVCQKPTPCFDLGKPNLSIPNMHSQPEAFSTNCWETHPPTQQQQQQQQQEPVSVTGYLHLVKSIRRNDTIN
jgi:hypothetical protein